MSCYDSFGIQRGSEGVMAVKIYFAHPINTYGTFIEYACLSLLRSLFPDAEIVNPSDEKHKQMVKALKAADPEANVMSYFLELVNGCDAVAILPFSDGMIGAGAYDEAVVGKEAGGSVWIISLDPLSISRARDRDLHSGRKLSIEDTRARVYYPDRTIRPYI